MSTRLRSCRYLFQVRSFQQLSSQALFRMPGLLSRSINHFLQLATLGQLTGNAMAVLRVRLRASQRGNAQALGAHG